ncbi:MAG: hypothetical protein WCT03_08030 [Candidatus Obscuribacterales bacterium]
MTANGKCPLCLKRALLVRSHVIPNFVIKWSKNEKNALLPSLLTESSPSAPVQQALYLDDFMCEVCEGIFAEWEQQFSSLIFKPHVDAKLTPSEQLFKEPWMRLVSISFAWRVAHASLIKDQGRISAWMEAIIKARIKTWRRFLICNTRHYAGPKPIWRFLETQDFDPIDTDLVAEMNSLPDDYFSYLSRVSEYGIAVNGANIELFIKLPQIVMTLSIVPNHCSSKLDSEPFDSILKERARMISSHIEANTTEIVRQQRTDSILRRTSEAQRLRFFASRGGEAMIIDKHLKDRKAAHQDSKPLL